MKTKFPHILLSAVLLTLFSLPAKSEVSFISVTSEEIEEISEPQEPPTSDQTQMPPAPPPQFEGQNPPPPQDMSQNPPPPQGEGRDMPQDMPRNEGPRADGKNPPPPNAQERGLRPPEDKNLAQDIDDEMIKKYQGSVIYRYKVCAQGNVLNTYKYGGPEPKMQENNTPPQEPAVAAPAEPAAQEPQDNTQHIKIYSEIEVDKEVKCNYYYAKGDDASKLMMAQAALKDFNLQNPTDVIIKDAVEVKEVDALPFNIEGSQITQEDARAREGNYVHKKVFANGAKIRKLYSYETNLASQMARLIQNRSSNALPARITVYEYYPEAGSPWAGAVIVFNEMEKNFTRLNDLTLSSNLYDVKPDFAYKYALK